MNCLGAGSWTGAAGRTSKVGTSGVVRKNAFQLLQRVSSGLGVACDSLAALTHWPLYRKAGTICETGETGKDFLVIAFSVPAIDENVSSLKAASGV
jgi:hypothetical protein